MTHTRNLSPAASAEPAVARPRAADPAFQAFVILRSAFTLAPILFGADKFAHLLVNWDKYLAPAIAGLSPFSVHVTMDVVGVVEIVAGIVVALVPRYGAPLVAVWLTGIVVNLLLVPGYFDVALRDFGLLLAALALWRLAAVYDTPPLPWRQG